MTQDFLLAKSTIIIIIFYFSSIPLILHLIVLLFYDVSDKTIILFYESKDYFHSIRKLLIVQ